MIFVNRQPELKKFKSVLQGLKSGKRAPFFMLFGNPGMGKSYLMKKFRRIAKAENCLTIWIDCHNVNLSLEVVLDRIYSELSNYSKEFEGYRKTAEKAAEIDKVIDENLTSASTERVAESISKGAGKVVEKYVPGAELVGAENIGKFTQGVITEAAEGLSKLRKRIAQNHLKKKEDREFFNADSQKTLCLRLAEALNEISKKEKLVLFVDRFEKLQQIANSKSKRSYDEYWRDCFLKNLGDHVLVVQGGRQKMDYVARLERAIEEINLKPFRPTDLQEYIRQKVTSGDIAEFAQILHKHCLGYPVAVAILTGGFQHADFWQKVAQQPQQVRLKKSEMIRQCVDWLLDEEKERSLIYRLAVICRKGKIDKDVIRYLYKDDNLEFPQIDQKIRKLASRYSFIDVDNWTFHEVPRKYILGYIKIRDPEFLSEENRKMIAFLQKTRGGEAT